MPPPTLAVLDADFPDLANYSRFVAAGPSGPTGDVAHGAAVARVVANALDGSVLAGLTPDPVAISFASDDLATSFASALAAPYAPAGQAIADAVAEGRDGLGTILVFAAGNARKSGDNVNQHNFQNHPATIAVGALDADGQPADYATPGAALLLAARGSDVPLGDDPTAGEPVTVSGTSFAAPQVSAAVARMLEVNPALTSRDVQTILANTATPVAKTASQDAPDPGYPAGSQAADPSPVRGMTNGAEDWNGGGRVFDNRTGFGALDADAATRLAAAWTRGATHGDAARASAEVTPAASIPDGGDALVVPFELQAGVDVEQVTLDVDITHSWIGDLTLALVSPSGTRSVLLDRPGNAPDSQGFGSSADDIAFDLTSNAFRGEASEGTWRLEVQDVSRAFAGTLDAAVLEVAGSAAGHDDTYIFTDAFADLALGGGTRAELADTGGDDHLLAAALSGDATIDLTPGATSVLAGRALTLLGTTAIEAATGGAGDDLIRGNALDNRLAGGPGADVLHGGAGDDIIEGGFGDDWFAGGAGADIFVPGTGANTIADFDPWAGDRLALEGRADETDNGGYGDVTVRPTDEGVLLSMDDGSSVHIEGINTFDADWFIA